MEKKKKIWKVLQFLLQILVAAATSWGTATGMSSFTEDPIQVSTCLDLDHPVGIE